MKFYIGIDVGGTKIAYGLFDEARKLLVRKQTASDDQKEGQEFFEPVLEIIREFMEEAGNRGGTVEGIGIGITGFVDFEKGALTKTASLPKLNNFAVVDYLKSRLDQDICIVMDNDCHCGALAEYRQGAGRGRRNMLYCPVSTGISSSMIIDGRLFRGSNGASGESGHMLAAVPEDVGMACSCGNVGCFNSLGSGKAILNYVKKWITEDGEKSILPELAGGVAQITTRHINEAYEKGDPVAIRAVEQMAHYLSIWIFNVYMLLNIDCIVFSGGLLAMGDKLLGRMKEEFERYHTNEFPVEFFQTELGSDSGLIGAVELLFD